MKQVFIFIVFIFSSVFLFSQEYIEVKINNVSSDYITESTKMGTKRVIEDPITGLKATEVTVFNERKYMRYQLLDSVFRYDSLLPTEFPNYSLSDIWGDYTPDYGYDKTYSDYSDGYDDFDYDATDGFTDEYDYGEEDEKYDEEMVDEYKVDEESTDEETDTTLVYDEDEDILDTDEEEFHFDSTYVFLDYELESLAASEIQNNFTDYIPDALDAFSSIPGHKVHKIMVLDTLTIIERDTLTNFQLESVSWPSIRQLPLKLFIEQKLDVFGKNDPNYQVALSKPLTYESIFQQIMNTKSTFDIPSVAWDSLMSFAIDPNEYLTDVVWLEYLIPYYSEKIQEPYLRQIFVDTLKRKKTAKILEFKKICGYDFREERSFKNIIKDTTIFKNPRFERSIDPDKKVPIIIDNSQLAFNVTPYLNKDIGRMDYEYAGVISSIYELEENTMADPKTGQPITYKRIKLDANNKPILLETASFGVTFKSLSLESLGITVRNMRYDISKLTRNKLFIDQNYLRTIGKL